MPIPPATTDHGRLTSIGTAGKAKKYSVKSRSTYAYTQ